MINTIYNEDCMATMQKMINQNILVDLVLTSPPYNNSKPGNQKSRDNHVSRYDIYIDQRTDEEYIKWSVDLFNSFDKILKPDGTILYNINYGTSNPNLVFLLVADLVQKTNFMIGDIIGWKKKSALPNNRNKNKLTRIWEFVFIFCRKNEYNSYHCNKTLKTIGKGENRFYNCLFNFVEAANNDGPNELNKATFSSELCDRLLSIYARPQSLVFDPFMGTGTTAVACVNKGMNFIGSELSEKQVEYAKNRIINIQKDQINCQVS